MKELSLVFENGEMKGKYDIIDKDGVKIANVPDLIIALQIKAGMKDRHIIDNARKQEMVF